MNITEKQQDTKPFIQLPLFSARELGKEISKIINNIGYSNEGRLYAIIKILKKYNVYYE